MRWLMGVVALVVGLSACARVSSTALSTGTGAPPWTGAMWLSITQPPPPGAIEVGVAEASGPVMVDELVPQLMERGRELGGNYVFVQTIQTRFEIVHTQSTQQYQCGTVNSPKTCTRIVHSNQEVPVTQIIARAYRAEAMR